MQLFAPITKVSAEQRIVEGYASTEARDDQGEIIRQSAIAAALPDYMRFGNIREMHRPLAAGKALAATVDGNGLHLMAKVIDPLAWEKVKERVYNGFSIGGRVTKRDPADRTIITGIELLEISLVDRPANPDAVFSFWKAAATSIPISTGEPAASGPSRSSIQIILPPGVSGLSKPPDRRDITKMTTVSEHIQKLEDARVPKATRLDELKQKVLAAGRTFDEAEEHEASKLKAEIETIDKSLELFRFDETKIAATAQPVGSPASVGQLRAAIANSPIRVPATAKEKTEPGVAFARLVKVRAVSRLEILPQLEVAEKMYGRDSETYQILAKAGEVLPGTAASGNWGYDLISQEGAAAADFVEYLRAGMITGKFGVNGVPAMRRIGFYEPYVIQTGAGAGYWVGEAKPIPLTSFDFDRSTLTPLKLGNIAMLSERNIRYSDPKSDIVIRDQLARVLIETEDTAFIDPANNGSSNIKPASITNGAESIASTGDDADDARLDMRALLKKFTDANNPPRMGVFVMSTDNAVALGSMVNALGQPEFTGIGMDGGRMIGLPVIVSDHAGDNVVLVNASDIYYSDEGAVQVDVSREASIEMKNQAEITQDGAAATGAAMVSTFQNMLVAFRAVKTVNWKLRRSSAVAYLTGVSWGGAVPAS